MKGIQALLAEDRPVTWLFAGDSITQGAVHTMGWRDYTELFDERLYELGRSADVVANTAVSGWRVQSIRERVDERVLRFRPDAVFLMFGTNDAMAGGDGLDRFAADYAETIDSIRKGGTENIVVQTTVPMVQLKVAPSETGITTRIAHIPAYVEATRMVAQQADVRLIDHWRVWEGIADQLGHYTEGAFHPNEYGHRLIAHTLFRELDMWDDDSRTCRLFVP